MHNFTLDELIDICRRAKMQDDCPEEAFEAEFWDCLTERLEELKGLMK